MQVSKISDDLVGLQSQQAQLEIRLQDMTTEDMVLDSEPSSASLTSETSSSDAMSSANNSMNDTSSSLPCESGGSEAEPCMPSTTSSFSDTIVNSHNVQLKLGKAPSDIIAGVASEWRFTV